MDLPEKRIWRWLVLAYGWATGMLYHSLAWAYDAVAWLVSFGEWAQWRRDSLDYLRPGSVLEVGFGTGALLISLAEKGLDVVGLELSPQMHRVTRRKLKRQKLFIPCVRGRSESLPFSPARFSNVIVTFPSNYIARPETLRSLFRVLRGGGRVIVAGLGVQFTTGWKRRLTAWFLSDPSGYFVNLLADTARATGFLATIISHSGADYVQPILILEKPDGI